ncbi:phage prohead protease, HK97 family [Ketogulonicigenium robustum]|uniref:Phage prohead protease, HK97 family n=1 Tax=Ketogulonicigenium robustum TaxID=92947 RepID=A0A1W6NYK9_9RHOB|nr:HK97 family phage prohead protease [Ketogulonicigenium robustum]ARO14269.1 phage prohead protease, HK97 family [Ketogulonicigenium robustum]
MDLEFKYAALTPHNTGDGLKVSGYASLFGVRDQGGDVLQPGAFAASLAALKTQGNKVRMLWQHDPNTPIGVWDDVSEDATGLHVSGRLLPDVAKAREVAALLAAGAIDGLSIGYRTLRATKAADGSRLLHEVALWEVSLVTFPMLQQARVTQKADDSLLSALRQARATLANFN